MDSGPRPFTQAEIQPGPQGSATFGPSQFGASIACPVCGCTHGIVVGIPGALSCPVCKTGCYAPLPYDVQANLDEADRIKDRLTDVGAEFAALRSRAEAAEERAERLAAALREAAAALEWSLPTGETHACTCRICTAIRAAREALKGAAE